MILRIYRFNDRIYENQTKPLFTLTLGKTSLLPKKPTIKKSLLSNPVWL